MRRRQLEQRVAPELGILQVPIPASPPAQKSTHRVALLDFHLLELSISRWM